MISTDILPTFWQLSPKEQVADGGIILPSNAWPDYGKTQASEVSAAPSFSSQDIKIDNIWRIHK